MTESPPLSRLPLYLSLLILPLAVAGQNIGMGVYALMLFAQIYRRRKALPLAELARDIGVPVAASLAYIAWGLVTSALNPAVPFAESGSFAFGYLSWALLPPVFFLAQARLTRETLERLEKCLAVVAAVMGAVAIAQLIFGFKLEGAHFVDAIKRSQGFYSHPLTFAYVMLFFVPIGWIGVLRRPANGAAWVILAGGLAGVFASNSRSVQAGCVAAIVVEAVLLAKGRSRVIAGLVIAALAAAVLVTDNPMKERFTRTAMDPAYDVKSGYKDDRLAFWDVHWLMVKERPLIGHGENISTAYRTPYYEKLGLGGLTRKFEAHDLYLQVLTNNGVVGLAIFLVWFGWALQRAWRLSREGVGGRMAFTALVVFALASITQNSFQDSEVRYALTVLVSALCLAPAPRRRA